MSNKQKWETVVAKSDKQPAKVSEKLNKIRQGGAAKYHQKAKEEAKLFARDRLQLLLDEGKQFIEDAAFANCLDPDLPADGVITGIGQVMGKTVCLMANDSTVKAGSWGKRTVEKIIRVQETAIKMQVPIIYLVDSAGARITDQVEMFPGRRGAGEFSTIKSKCQAWFHKYVFYLDILLPVVLIFLPSATL